MGGKEARYLVPYKGDIWGKSSQDWIGLEWDLNNYNEQQVGVRIND